MNRHPLVSIVLPTRDRARLLRRAHDSVLAQTRDDWELIIVDDASADSTPEMVQEWTRHDARVRYIRAEVPGGAAAARNRGIDVARGPYVAFIDDDCEWVASKVAVQTELLIRQPDVGLVYSPYVLESEHAAPAIIGDSDVSHGDTRGKLLRSNVIGTPSVMTKRELLEACGGFDSRLPRLQDWDLWLRLASRTRFAFVPEPLVRCASVAGSISTRSDALVAACALLESKAESELGVASGELAELRYALGHMLMIGGAPVEGCAYLWHSVRRRPWPPRRIAMSVAARLSPDLYTRVVRARESRRINGRAAPAGVTE